MTRYVGSRASCYPPDSVSFRRFAGARADCGLPRAYVDKRARGGLALRLAGARLGKYPESGGCARSKHHDTAGDTDVWRESSADARDPPPSPLRKAIVLSGRKVARSRSIERNNFSCNIFSATLFSTFYKFGFLRFRSCDDRESVTLAARERAAARPTAVSLAHSLIATSRAIWTSLDPPRTTRTSRSRSGE